MANWGYHEYVPAAAKKARAAKSLERLKKTNPNLAPIQISGRKLARTWWGVAWNTNLERYADYSNRIGRGRSYVRNGAVLNLQIEPGKITGLVQGSGSRPYEIKVLIQPLRPDVWTDVSKACAGSIQSLKDLVEGRFPKPLSDLFTAKGAGLFPTPREIRFDCSCPDYADLCKHVAAVLYGVGARLDEDPTLFFVLRQVNMDDLITHALNQTTDSLLEKSRHKSSRTLADDDLSGLFGVDVLMSDVTEPPPIQRGRPAKIPQPAASPAADSPQAQVKKRGRPAKTPQSVASPAADSSQAQAKKRGRPAKAAQSAASPAADSIQAPVKKRGWPAKEIKKVK